MTSTRTMAAVGYRSALPLDNADSLVDLKLPVPVPGPRDLLIRVHAVSVNPVDVKTRARRTPEGEYRILGFDSAGVVEAVGSEVTLFAPGDEVYAAGSIDRQGSDAQYQLVDERIVGRKPRTLDFVQAAALPLTAITAWESLFDRLRFTAESTGTILVLGAAGGVGSILTQLTTRLTGVTVIGTASRPESAEWVRSMGATHTVDHHGDLVAQVLAVAPGGVDAIFSPHTPDDLSDFITILKPGGAVVAIDDPAVVDVRGFKDKSLAFHWELMFTRPVLQTDDMIEQHRLLNRVADLIDEGRLTTSATTVLGPLNAETLKEAHRLVESGRTIGKVVLPVD